MKVTSVEDIAKISSADIDTLNNLLDWLDKLDALKNTPEVNEIRRAIEDRKTKELNALILRVRVINNGLVGQSNDDVIRLALSHCYEQEINFDE